MKSSTVFLQEKKSWPIEIKTLSFSIIIQLAAYNTKIATEDLWLPV